MIDPALKEQLIGRFRDYLDTADLDVAEQQEQAGTIDLLTLFTELAALKNEVRLESRQVKQALDHSGELIDGLRESNRQFSNELARQRRQEDELRLAAERPLLLELVELRDRIEAARQSLLSYRPGLLEGLSDKRARWVQSVGDGMEITQRRLDGLLGRYRVSPIEVVGRRLDPHSMRVSGTEQREDQDEGIVLGEVRRGYRRADQVLRLAEVIVNKRGTEL